MADIDNNDNISTDDRKPIGSFVCYASTKIQAQAKKNLNQAQVTVPHAKVQQLLGLAGYDKDTILSRKRGFGLRLDVRTPKGTLIQLTQADTHAIWYSHQDDENAKKLLTYLVQKGGGRLDLLSVEGVTLQTGSRAEVTAEDMVDCPF